MAKNPIRITTVETQPINVMLTTLRLEGHKLTRTLYDQIPSALPFSTHTWLLNSQLLGWVNLYPKAPSRVWCLLFVRDHTLYHTQLPQTIAEFPPYHRLRTDLRASQHRLDTLLWGLAVTHSLVHSPAPTVQADPSSSTITISVPSESYRLQLDPDDPLWALIQAPPASDAARLRWKLPGIARLYTQWPDSDSTLSSLFRAHPQFTHVTSQLLNQLHALWIHWSQLDPEAPDAVFWSQLGIPSDWVALGHSPLRRESSIDTWGPTAPWLNPAVYAQALQPLRESCATLAETATKIETLWTDLADRMTSLPQIYLGL